MAHFPTLSTQRLLLRHFVDSDLHPFMDYRNDPDVARYQGWDGISLVHAQAFIEEQKSQEVGVPGQWFQIAIERRDGQTLIGDCALRVDLEDSRQAHLGYTLARSQQGQGFAREAVSALLTYAFGELHLHRVVAIVDCENAASIALLERLRFRREGWHRESFWNRGQWTDEYLYAIVEWEWARAHGGEGMTELTTEHAAADGTAPLLSGEEVEALLEEVPQWHIRDKKLRRDLRVKNFAQALALLNQIGELAESENHHPDLYLHSWNHLSVEFYTHTVDGLSRNDFILAAKCSQIFAKSA